MNIKNPKYNTVQIDNVIAFAEKLVQMIQDLELTIILLKNIVTASEQKIIGLQKNDRNQDTHIRQNDEKIKQLTKKQQIAEIEITKTCKEQEKVIQAMKIDIDHVNTTIEKKLTINIDDLRKDINFLNKSFFATGGTFFVGAIAVIVYLWFKINCLEKALIIQNQKH